MLMSMTEGDAPARDDAYSVRHVARLLDVPEHRLRYWSQSGFISPSVRRGGRVFYSFRDLIELKVAKALLESGMPLRRVRRSLGALGRRLPEAQHMLSSLRIRCEGDELVVEHAEGAYEAESGQLVLDFDTSNLQKEAAEVYALPWVGDDSKMPAPSTAYGWFLRGCELEAQWDGSPVDQAGFEAAREAYEQALSLDPELAAAWTNLGSMFAEMGADDEARHHFAQALRCDPMQAEAQMNLAELHLRDGDSDAAIDAYRKVLSMAPDNFEAHYGLARALLDVGGKVQAVAHLQRFCEGAGGAANDDGDPELQARVDAAHAVLTKLEAELRES